MDRKNIAATEKMAEVFNNVKGFEMAISNPATGKMLMRYNGVSFLVTIDAIYGNSSRGHEADSRPFEEIVEDNKYLLS